MQFPYISIDLQLANCCSLLACCIVKQATVRKNFYLKLGAKLNSTLFCIWFCTRIMRNVGPNVGVLDRGRGGGASTPDYVFA